MPRNKFGLWGEPFWWLNFFSTQRQQHIFDEDIIASLQIIGNDDCEIVSEANQTLVKGSIMNGRQAKSIARVEPIGLVDAPRHDVTGN